MTLSRCSFAIVHNSVHIADKIKHMNGDDGLGIGRDLALDVFGVDRQTLIYVHEHRNSADCKRRDRCGYPSIGRHQDFITWPDPRSC